MKTTTSTDKATEASTSLELAQLMLVLDDTIANIALLQISLVKGSQGLPCTDV